MSITYHRYNSTEEIVRDKNRILQKLGVHEDYAFELYDAMVLDDSDAQRVDRLRQLNWLLSKNDEIVDKHSKSLDDMVADAQLLGDYDAGSKEFMKILDDVCHGNNLHTLIITRGLPASGKSTFARAWVEEDPGNRVEINRDSTRKFLGIRHIGTEDEEKTVTAVNDALLRISMEQGKDIIVSDTNLRVRYIKRLLKNVDDTYDVELKDFIVDVDTCVKRDAMRPDSERVGEETIREMNKKFPTKTWKTLDEIRAAIGKDNAVYLPYKNNPENERAILVDIDGTLAHHEGRRDIFDYSAVGLDSVDESVRDALIDAHQVGKTVIILSGRSESGREDTEQWLADNGIPYEHLFMRKNGDMRADWIIKDEIIREHIQDNFHVMYCLDDRNQVVDHNRKMGYKVFQVAPGNF